MYFTCRTVYDFETLFAFNKTHSPRRTVFAVFWGICAACMLGGFGIFLFLLLATDAEVELTDLVISFVLATFSVLAFLAHTVLFQKTLKKQAAAQVCSVITFDEDTFTERATHKDGQTDITRSYSALVKITESQSAIYLYIAPASAVIVSKGGFEQGTPEALVAFLRTKVAPERIKMK